jgi:cell division protein FtsQ
MVKGWQPQYRPALAQLLTRRPQFGAAVQQIRFEPGGSLWLDTSTLGAVRFGPLDERLARRIDVLEHLLRELPAQLKGRQLQSLDLSDPEQPEISLPGPTRAAPPAAASR